MICGQFRGVGRGLEFPIVRGRAALRLSALSALVGRGLRAGVFLGAPHLTPDALATPENRIARSEPGERHYDGDRQSRSSRVCGWQSRYVAGGVA